MAIIKLENVSWAYSRAHDWALRNISLTIEEGECVAIMGENGAGKTTLCRLINGLIPHSLPGKLVGSVMVDGIETAASSVAQLSTKVGTVFEDPYTQLFTATVADEVAFALENLLMPVEQIKERVGWALGVTGLSDYVDFSPASLSGGQKQRLAIAAAVAMAEKVLVLDEPASQLDPDGAQEVLSLIRDLRLQKQLTVVMATNAIEEAEQFADRVCFLEKGIILEETHTEARVERRGSHRGTEAQRTRRERKVFTSESLASDTEIVEVSENKKNHRMKRMNTNEERAGKAIEIFNLHFEYAPGRPILNNINLAVNENEFIAITGRNGCGKTTLLKNISGLLRPQKGKILLRGEGTADREIGQIAGEIGFVMQDPDHQLFESTVYDEVAFALKRGRGKGKPALTKQEIREKTEEALSLVNLLDKREDFPLALGRADRVKTVFAAVLAMGPRIIMLDEPIAGQDEKGCHLFMELLSDLHEKGYTILMVTHNMKVVEEYAQRKWPLPTNR